MRRSAVSILALLAAAAPIAVLAASQIVVQPHFRPYADADLCRMETPFHVAPDDVADLSSTIRAVTVEGRLRSIWLGPSLGWAVEDWPASVRIIPYEEIESVFRERAMSLQGKLVEITGCFGEPDPTSGAQQRGEQRRTVFIYSFLEIPERPREAPLSEVSIGELLDEAQTFDGRHVRVEGNLAGEDHFTLPQGSRLDPHDWALEDDGRAIWVGGRGPEGEGFRLDPSDPGDQGVRLLVEGTVSYSKGRPRLRADVVRLVRPGRAPGRVTVLSAAPPAGSEIPPATVIEVRFNRPMAGDSFAGRVVLAYPEAGGPGPADPRVRYDPDWWCLTVETAALVAGRSLELRLLDGIRDERGHPLAPLAGGTPEGVAVALRYRVAAPD